jgi:hypothetical protein
MGAWPEMPNAVQPFETAALTMASQDSDPSSKVEWA